MTAGGFILAIDQGTTSSRAILFNGDGASCAVGQHEFTQHFPDDGWVEHDPEEIWQTTVRAVRDVLSSDALADGEVLAVGITNQRETVVVWDRETGEPVYRAIVWQDRRTAQVCRELEAAGHLCTVQGKTGLLLDPYFSATKVAWILDHVPDARARAERGELAFGTIDCFLIWRLTGGRVHATDATNASRTSLFNIAEQAWDEELLTLFRVPAAILPDVKDCAADYGTTDVSAIGAALPIRGVAGDQQAATIGQCCFDVGAIKSTYGTGCFALVNTGRELIHSRNRLLSTVAYRLDGQTTYALEGSIFVAGAAVQWLRDGIGVIEDAQETEALAADVDPNHGVLLVPAFTGLGAPHWDPDARGAVLGMTRATGRAELARATLESVCFQTYDLLYAMRLDGVAASTLRVDGGMVANDWLCQHLADLLDLSVVRPKVMETTALGAAYLAGLGAGLYRSLDDVRAHWQLDQRFEARHLDRERIIAQWHRAVESVRTFAR